jgi:hypothetical protein
VGSVWALPSSPVNHFVAASLPSTAAAMRDKGLDPESDPVTRTDFVRRMTLQLNDMVRKGKIEKIGRGRAMRWKLAADTNH